MGAAPRSAAPRRAARFALHAHTPAKNTPRPSPQAGRFAQIFVLNANPAGGFYIKVDICRWSPGAAKEAHHDPHALGKNFVGQYYSMFNSNRAALAGVYSETKSQVMVEGKAPAVGRAAIVELLGTLPGDARAIDSLDTCLCVDATPSVVALVTGKIKLEGQENALQFMQCFLLTVEAGAPYCANEIFSLNYA